ncbi:hypothetical protein SAMN02745947_01750 [Rhodococcus rhodochrous J3]|uniref:DUF6474 family protein n=2 Tax=Rhodococcus rhodochrous TaxID=1829 RepID=A0AA47AC77_RHORH|nr:DUF6474 family protein [Rhodococcus rhodochrous]MBF4480641.1 hypothetical protein [Rhodococcus rhodochrous]MCB8911368.1 hypothetical protein [Rhodococcus rhodochrous]TWH42144.1 hypothetical protein L612_000400001540 [Rhodococcus rhodochrous J38]UZF45248.1 DUF6474 family protein [Rhodococcus rhodochrous]SMG27850.1 hypothetical protein SAMN02745947_01750 [Rhodococcus rhodochrous J3]
MGLFTRKRRATRRAEAKALRTKAKLEARLVAKNRLKNDRRAAKAQAKIDKKLAKSQVKLDQELARSQAKVEKEQIATLKAQKKAAENQGLTAAKVRRYLGVARLLAPVLVPIVYQAVTALRGQLDSRRAQQLGVPIEELGSFTGHGARLSARIAGAEQSLAKVEQRNPKDAETQKFATATRERLTDLTAAVQTAEQMPAARRKSAHAAISSELDGIEADLLARLGVR